MKTNSLIAAALIGTTFTTFAALEEHGFRNACIKSIEAIMNK